MNETQFGSPVLILNSVSKYAQSLYEMPAVNPEIVIRLSSTFYILATPILDSRLVEYNLLKLSDCCSTINTEFFRFCLISTSDNTDFVVDDVFANKFQ